MSFIIAVIGLCIFFVGKKRTEIARILDILNYSSIVAVLLYCSFCFSVNAEVARLIYGFFMVNRLLIWLCLLNYVFQFTEGAVDSKFAKVGRMILFFVFVLDLIFFMMNIKGEHAFSIVQNISSASVNHFTVEYKPLIALHYGLNVYIFLNIVVLLIRKCSKVIRFERQKYLIVLMLFSAVIVVNLFFTLIKFDFFFDITIFFYPLISVITCYFAYNFVSKKYERRILSILAKDVSNGIVCFASDGKCIYMNTLARKIYGNDLNAIVEQDVFNYPDVDSAMKETTLTVDGQDRIFIVEYKKIYDEKKRLLGSYLKFDDKTAEIENYEKERFRATHDELTNLLNRKAFFAKAEEVLKASPDEGWYVLSTNIRKFKLVNDLFGVKAGDELLLYIAGILKNMENVNCVCGRISADGFAILVPKKIFNLDFVTRCKEKIGSFIKNRNFRVNLVIGVYEVSNFHENAQAMYDKAVLAMKSIGDNFDNTVAFYNSSLMEKLIREKSIISEFENALCENQFEIYYQPQIGNESGKVEGVEALIRWNHPVKGLLLPADFLPALTKGGFIYKLDEYIWNVCAKKIAQWQEKGIKLFISVNISAKDFYYSDICEDFVLLCKKYGISSDLLHIEIKEDAFMREFNLSLSLLKRLQTSGFSVAIDNFGAGYSSLNMLKDIKADALKINMSALVKSAENERELTILDSVVKMAKQLDIKIVCECIENEDQVKVLNKIGCDILQGFYFSKPLPEYEFEKKYIGA